MPTTTANLGLTLPTPNVDTGWGGTLNSDFTIIDNLFAGAGTGTSVGLNVGSAKTLTLGGTMILGSGDGTAGAAAPVSIRGAAKAGTNLTGFDLVIDAPNGTGTGGSGGLVFRTAPAGISSTSPNTMQSSMVITSAGNVGIGTSSPSYKLDTNGQIRGYQDSSAGASVFIASNTSTANNTTKAAGIAYQGRDTVGTVKEVANIFAYPLNSDWTASALGFWTRNSDVTAERMRIDSSGDVTIYNTLFVGPTTYDQFQATVSGNTSSVKLGATVSGGQASIDYDRAVGAMYFRIGSVASRANAVTIDSSGNVGIGTASPIGKFEVFGAITALRQNVSTSYTSLRFFNDIGSSSRTLEIDYYGSAAAGGERAEITTTGAYPLLFLTSNTERVRIASNGAIGLSGANYGTAGQVLTSNGSGGSPSWQDMGVSQGTVQTFAASGNSFTGIPSTVKTIVINIAGWDPSADAYIRIGTSSGFNTTSYVSSGSLLSASGTSTLSDTLGFIINANSSVLGHGSIRLTNLSGNYWVCDYTIGSSGNLVMVGGGGLGLSGVLDRVQIIPKTGSFAASGSVNINYF